MSNTGFICPVPGAVVGKTTVSGNAYVESSFQYSHNHLWRDVGILFGFSAFFTATYLAASGLNLSTSGKPGTIRFLRKRPYISSRREDEVEDRANEGRTVHDQVIRDDSHSTTSENMLFSWQDVTYDVKVGNETRRLLDNASGWVKSGSLTALMGVSGAGKTTLLDFLARRLGSGMHFGSITLSGTNASPAVLARLGNEIDKYDSLVANRRIGYVPQQDVLLETATVREELRLSAILRQPRSTTRTEKYRYVEEIIQVRILSAHVHSRKVNDRQVLGMQDFADALIGTAENGLNTEQRKLVSIGVELAAKPQFLLFLDEPTSGLDSQSSLTIVALLQKLAKSGMAILTTIHQPSAVLLQKFDRLIFLVKGGRTVYFGDIGPDSQSMVDYFENYGAKKCEASENPAEYLMDILASRADNPDDLDWVQIWRSSEKMRLQDDERDRISSELSNNVAVSLYDNHRGHFEVPIYTQLLHTSIRVLKQHWRTPSYVWGKQLLGLISSL
jgi:ABC-type multidrug transport system ATPase subunit